MPGLRGSISIRLRSTPPDSWGHSLTFICQLPFAEGTFHALVLVNALHHISFGLMIKARQEGIRVLGLGGYLIVIEPLPIGSFFEAFRAIEDETVVRLRRKRQSVSLPALHSWAASR